MKRIIVIGGGAAGLTAAYAAAFSGRNGGVHVTVVEKNERPARKLMITGKGRCNVTNNCGVETLLANVPKNGRFLYSAFSQFCAQDTMTFFESIGVPLKTERGNRVFPVSDKAGDIVDALIRVNRKSGVELINGTVREILAPAGMVSGVRLSDGRLLTADRVILATGGMSYPVTGSTGDGYRMAAALGHTVTALRPSLVPLECHEGFCSRLSGLSLKNVTLSLFEEGRKKPVFFELGEMLFTHFGISGPLVLSASAHLRDPENKSCYAKIDLKPALSPEQLDKRILRDFSQELNRDFSHALDKLLPKSLVPVIVRLSGIPEDRKVNQISREQRETLNGILKGLTLHITRFRPIEEAIITSGGIAIREIDPSTMRSKLIEGLSFAGEIIDVDAYTGGFNLQIAFSTGYLAGMNI